MLKITKEKIYIKETKDSEPMCDFTIGKYKIQICCPQKNNAQLQSLRFAKQFQILQNYYSKIQMLKLSKSQKILENHKIHFL